jgi:hypothetical protein
MIRHAAVCIVRELRSSGVALAPDMFQPPTAIALNDVADSPGVDVGAKLSDAGLVRCRASSDTREIIKVEEQGRRPHQLWICQRMFLDLK